MADYWTTPKTNWVDNDAIGYGDLNRIEANISANRDANFRRVQGFGYTLDNSVVGEDGVVTILPGSAYTSGGVPIKMAASFVKNLTTWAAGNGAIYGGMASAVTVAAHTWYYAFVIMDPTDGSTEIMFDDNPSGTNVSSGIYTEKRFINSFKTGAAGGDGSFDLIEMFSTGDQVFINPDSMFPTTRGVNYSDTNDTYDVATLTEGSYGYALPERDVLAQLNIFTEEEVHAIGVISDYGNHFTVPTNFVNSGIRVGEHVFQSIIPSVSHIYGISTDCAIFVPDTRKVNIAYLFDAGTPELWIAVRGFTDDRLN